MNSSHRNIIQNSSYKKNSTFFSISSPFSPQPLLTVTADQRSNVQLLYYADCEVLFSWGRGVFTLFNPLNRLRIRLRLIMINPSYIFSNNPTQNVIFFVSTEVLKLSWTLDMLLILNQRDHFLRSPGGGIYSKCFRWYSNHSFLQAALSSIGHPTMTMTEFNE